MAVRHRRRPGHRHRVTDAVGRPGLTPRQLRERRDRRRSTAVAAVSTVVVFGAVALVVSRASGFDEVRSSFFDGPEFTESLREIVPAFWLNVRVFLVAEVFILVCALLLAVARSSRAPALFPVRLFATVYVDVFRGIPVLLVLFLLGFGVPALRLEGVPNDPVIWGTVALILSYSAYVSEVYRAGIDSVHETQRAAARAVGLTGGQSMRFVVLPQAVRRVVPALLNDFIALQKETSLLSVIGPIEAARQAQIESARSFNFTSYTAAALIFLAITIPLTRLTDHLLGRQRRRMTVGPAG
ncbi:MAG: amino acid ABC transporter permease [Acidimicrobiia bacterium]|nr:amino acid ABC transporter permease [Acidimicrobiia bacterium]